jgi:hypothetical protein
METKLTFDDSITNQREALVALGDTISRLSQCELMIKKLHLLDQIASQDIHLSITTKALYVDVVDSIFFSLKKEEVTLEQLATEIFGLLKQPKENQELRLVRSTNIPHLQEHRRVRAAATFSLNSSFGGFSASREVSLKKKSQPGAENPENSPSTNDIEEQLKKLALELTSDPSLIEFSTGLCRDNFIKMALSYINVKSCNQEKRGAYADLQKMLEASLTSHHVSLATCADIIALLEKQLPPEAQTPRCSSSHF